MSELKTTLLMFDSAKQPKSMLVQNSKVRASLCAHTPCFVAETEAVQFRRHRHPEFLGNRTLLDGCESSGSQLSVRLGSNQADRVQHDPTVAVEFDESVCTFSHAMALILCKKPAVEYLSPVPSGQELLFDGLTIRMPLQGQEWQFGQVHFPVEARDIQSHAGPHHDPVTVVIKLICSQHEQRISVTVLGQAGAAYEYGESLSKFILPDGKRIRREEHPQQVSGNGTFSGEALKCSHICAELLSDEF